ncbi:TPA: hypothetical protein ACRKKQ_005898, partial [Klebsiella michiganensis]
MATIVQSNMKFKGDVKLPSVNAPLPDGANLFADFSTGRYVIKHASGNVIRSAALTDILSFTCASVRSYVGSSGLIEYLQANEPAIEYHPLSLECLGLRTEYSSTNRLAWSQDFSQSATWSSGGLTVTPGDSTAPDGNTTATRLAETANGTSTVRTLLAATTS